MLLRDLQYFCAVARVENIARAAESLGVSQPTISKSVARLERQMRVRLLERLARGVRLSPAGTAFLRYANGANNLLRDAASEMREFRRHEAGVVRLGVGVGIAEPLVEDAIEQLSARYKDLRYELRGGMSDTLLDSLEAGRIDIVVTGMAPQTRTGLRWEVLMSDSLVFAPPRQHPLVRCKSISIEQLAASRLILPAQGTVTRVWVDSLFASEGLQPPLPFIESHASAREIPLAVRFDCVVLLPEAVFRAPAISRQLRRLVVPPHWDVQRPISVVTRVGRLNEHQAALVAALRR
jgi:LysR family pca operon transcriptional activator